MNVQEPTPYERAESLFARFQFSGPDREEEAFRRLLGHHPDLAEELRAIRRAWRVARQVLEGEGPPDTPGEDPPGTVDPAPDPATAANAALVRICGRRAESGRYVAPREIGRGGMGVVREVRDRVLDRRVAMKVMLGDDDHVGATDQGSRVRSLGRFVDEARVTAQLDHPGVVPVHDAGVLDDGVVFFTMKLVSGTTLREVLRRAASGDPAWSVARVVDVLRRASEALAFAHDRGVIHRDLKPANVMVGEYGETYVMDWGLASWRGAADAEAPAEVSDRAGPDTRATLEGQVLGTPAYMPPEQARGARAELSAAVDVYAMGAILYELLCGHPPYGDQAVDPREVLRCIERGPPTAPDRLAAGRPPELIAICAKALTRDPRGRYPDMRAFSEDLRAFAEQRVVRAHATGPLAELAKWITRNRGLAATAMVAAVTVAAVATWAYARVLSERNVARVEGQRADRKADDVLRLSALETLRALREEADDLWPQRVALDDDYARWEREARSLVDELGRHRERLDELRSRGARRDDAWVFVSDEDAWWHDQLTLLIAGLEDLADPERGLLGDGTAPPHGIAVPARRRNAASVEEITLRGEAARIAWARAAAELAADPRFEGWTLRPLAGLAPLGADPVTGLQEFWIPETGSAPLREDDGRLTLGEATAVVMVLVPGGTFRMGAQREDPAGENYDPSAKPEESGPDGGPIDVTLDPFFISRFEVTQGQFSRFTGENPGLWNHAQNPAFDLRQPVENVTWLAASEFVRRLGLQLPTEAQWEYACRAGASTPYHSGADPAGLASVANVADRTYARLFEGVAQFESFDDGFGPPAPPGSLLPNAFGLHDMHGNVWEWCRDVYVKDAYRATTPRPGDGLLADGEGDVRSLRGGSCFTPAVSARASLRAQGKKDMHSYVGVRPVLPLDGGGG